MKVPFTWKVTGWFMVGWSAEFPAARCDRCGTSARISSPIATSRANCTCCRGTADTSAPTSATAARWSATASSARSTDGAGDPTAPTATSPISPTSPTAPAAARVPGARAVRLRLHVAPARRQGPAVGMPDIFHKFPQFETDPDAYYRPYPSSPPRRARARCTRRSSPRTVPTAPLPLRARRDGDARCAGLGEPSTRSGASSPAGPTPAATTRTRWRCGSTATSPGSASPSARSKARRTTG